MNPRTPTDAAHFEAQQVLPWLANGSLSGAELQRTEAHLQVCAACRAELALLHTVRAAGQSDVPGLDVDSALARLLPQLDAPAITAPAPAIQRGWREKFAANDRSWLRAGVLLQCCVIATLGVLLAHSYSTPDSQAGNYRALGATAAARSNLVVSFKPDTPERELRRILIDSGTRVVGGPTATGAWLLDTEGAAASAALKLRAEPAVLLAEPLGVEGRP